MTAFFVTATGTDIGKTFITAGLVRLLRARNERVAALKPIVSGYDFGAASDSDPGHLLAALGEPITAESIARISPWRFGAPLSPDMAAAREGRTVDFDALVDFSEESVVSHEGTLFIEGVGGIMVPLASKHTTLDWMTALSLPTILVTGNYLGAMSHTLSALDVLARRNLNVRVLIVNESASSSVPLNETADTLRRYIDDLPVVCVPRLQAPAHPAFEDLARLLA
jgi:dethiobiotin synthetase